MEIIPTALQTLLPAIFIWLVILVPFAILAPLADYIARRLNESHKYDAQRRLVVYPTKRLAKTNR